MFCRLCTLWSWGWGGRGGGGHLLLKFFCLTPSPSLYTLNHWQKSLTSRKLPVIEKIRDFQSLSLTEESHKLNKIQINTLWSFKFPLRTFLKMYFRCGVRFRPRSPSWVRFWETLTHPASSGDKTNIISLKVRKNKNFFGFDFEFCTISMYFNKYTKQNLIV
jgi:hypothetical protein